jgi:hypothetical protein
MTFIACAKVIFADCSSMDIEIALPYPLDGARNSAFDRFGICARNASAVATFVPPSGVWVDRRAAGAIDLLKRVAGTAWLPSK